MLILFASVLSSLSLSILKYIKTAVYPTETFVFIAEYYFIARMYQGLFIYLSVGIWVVASYPLLRSQLL